MDWVWWFVGVQGSELVSQYHHFKLHSQKLVENTEVKIVCFILRMREICCFHFYFSAGLWWYLSACLYVLYYHGTLRFITNVKYSSLHAECLAGWCALSLLLLTLISSIITKIFKSCFHLMILRTFEVIWRLLRWWWPDLRCLSFEVHNISLDLLHCAVCIMVHVSDGYMGILSNEIYFPGSINNKECFLFRSCFLKK